MLDGQSVLDWLPLDKHDAHPVTRALVARHPVLERWQVVAVLDILLRVSAGSSTC